MIQISVEEAHARVQSGEAIILDVRETYELEICAIEALNIPMAEVADRLEEIPCDKGIIVMCKSGKRAEAVANMLITDCDRTNVTVLEGGILSWIEKIATHLETY
ncbi:MAG: rhodanese-related sulfurtransferase [Crocinitomicaceae bacterium]|jgi:rhodanese-related sulfurtransferase